MTRTKLIGAASPLIACCLLAATPARAAKERALHDVKPAQTAAAAADKAVLLDIPETGQEKRRPPSGWCGEASIQMAMSYYGAYASQRTINRVGKAAHPDLYDDEVPSAMRNLGLEIKVWEGKGLKAHLAWLRAELAAGYPVVVGMKINPTEHRDWSLDHFVLAVGFSKDALTYNTTWKRQETRTDAQLSTQEKGLSIANPLNIYFGCAATGMNSKATPAAARPTRIKFVRLEEKQQVEKHVELHVTAENLQQGKRYRLVKFTDLAAAQKPVRRASWCGRSLPRVRRPTAWKESALTTPASTAACRRKTILDRSAPTPTPSAAVRRHDARDGVDDRLLHFHWALDHGPSGAGAGAAHRPVGLRRPVHHARGRGLRRAGCHVSPRRGPIRVSPRGLRRLLGLPLRLDAVPGDPDGHQRGRGHRFCQVPRRVVPGLGEDHVLAAIPLGKLLPAAVLAHLPGVPPRLAINSAQLVACGVIGLLTAVNIRGIREGAAVQNVFTVLKVAALAVLIGAGLLRGGQVSHFLPLFAVAAGPAAKAGFLAALAVALSKALFAYDSWYAVAFVAEEVHDSPRTLPRAMVLGCLLVTLLYVVANGVYLLVLPVDQVAGAVENRVAERVAVVLFGNVGSTLVIAAILVSTFGCLNGLILSGARVCYAMARERLFFRPCAGSTPAACPRWP